MGSKEEAEKEKLQFGVKTQQSRQAQQSRPVNNRPEERLLGLSVHYLIKGINNPPSSLVNLQANQLS